MPTSPTSLDYVTVDVFTQTRFCGNQLAVFLNAEGASDVQMQAIAREWNLPEVTFVLAPSDPRNTARVRIFTPVQEMPFAGHPNVGTAFVLAQRGDAGATALRFEEQAGLVVVDLLRDSGGRACGARIAAPRPLEVGPEADPGLVAACAGLRPDEIRVGRHQPLRAGVGLDFVFAEVAGRDALARATPDPSAFRALRRLQGLPDSEPAVHLYTWDPADPARIHARMFAPLLGIAEDPATGSASAGLAALLLHLAPPGEGALTIHIEQGVEMGRPSQLVAAAARGDDGRIRATVAGNCVLVSRGTVELG
jgi:trans-2,3-dihydro-3-hydroxyanthranilate isomerase